MKKRSQSEFARLRALARVSLIILASLSLNTCDLLKPGLGDKVDINPPSLAISSPQQNSYVKGPLTVKGTAADDLSLAKVTVRYVGSSGAVTKNITVSGGAWTIDIPTGTASADNLPDGEQKVTVTATDGSGKEVEALLLAYIDNIAPTVLVTVPQGYGTSKPIVSDYIDVKGEVWDRSPIVDVDVQLLAPDNSVLETKLADGTNTWSTRFITSARPDNQTYRYAIQATDKAGNTNTYYYHSQDIWAALTPGLLFPATDEIGKVDQTQSGTAGNITFAMLQALRIGITGSPKFGDFDKIADATLPVLHFSNLDPSLAITSNVIGNKVPITGYANPGPAGTPVDGTSIKAWIIPSTVTTWPALPNVDAGAVTWTSISSSVSFQIEPKVGGSYISSGRYKVKVSAKSTGSSNTTEITCGFLVDSGAPRIDSVLPDDLSLITRKTFTAGPLGGSGQSGIEIRAHATDDNAINAFTASSSLTSGGAALAGTVSAADSVDPGWYYVQVPLAAGNTDIWFDLQATDDAGTIARRTLHYIIDESAPTVSIDSPLAGSYVTGNSTTISGTASDNTGDVRYIYLWLGLSSATPPADFTTWNRLTGNASWVTTLPLATEGQYTVRAVAVDFAGNQSAVAIRSFFLDQANPTLTETSIGPTPAYRNIAFSLSGTAADTNALANITITQKKNGGASTTVLNQALSGKSQAWSWSVPGAETDGTFEYTITVTDVAGKTAAAVSRTVVYDRVKPTVTFTSLTPVIGTNTVNGIVTLTVAVSDTTGLATVWYRYGDSGAFAEITTNKTTPSLVIDTTTFTDLAVTNAWIRAIDLAGNTQEVAQALAVDQSSDKPVISLTNLSAARNTPALGWGNLLESNAKVQGSATDDDSLDSSTIEISVDAAASWAAVSQKGPSGKVVSFEHNIASLAEGMHYLHIQASDLATAKMGLPFASNAIGPVYFVVDKYPPSTSVTSPAQDAVVNAGFAISGTASDANGLADLNSDTVSDVEVSTNGGASWTVLSAPGGAWSYPVAVDTTGHTFDGSHTYKFRATDRFAKTTVADYRFVVDTTGPTLAVSAPAGSSWLSGSTSTATGNASDGTGTGVAAVYWWAGDSLATPPALLSSWNTATGTTFWSGLMDVSGLGEGNRRLSVKAVDAAGNWSATVQRDFGIDQANPVLTVTNIATGVVGRSALFPMDGTAADTNALASIKVEQKKGTGTFVEVYNQGISGSQPPQPWSVTGLPRDPATPADSLLADGLFEYRATLTDVAGRTHVVTRTVQIDTTAPTVGISNPGVGAWLSGTAYNASGTATDPLSGVATVEWSTNGTTWQSATGTSSWSATLDLNTLGEGQKTLSIRATDNASNTSGVATRTFQIDQSNPSLSGISLATGLQFKNAVFTLDATAEDTNALANVTVTQSKNGGTAIEVFNQNYSVTSQAWSLTGLPRDPAAPGTTLLSEGNYEYVITVRDVVGKTTSATRTAMVDTSSPVLTITDPTSGGWADAANYTIRGTVSDGAGKGVTQLAWSLDNATWTPIALTGLAWNATIDVSGGGEGPKTLYMKASDGLNPDATSSVAFSYDLSAPSIIEDQIATPNLVYRTADFTIGGTISDTNGVVSVKVEASRDGGAYATVDTQPKTGKSNVPWSYPKTVDNTGTHNDDGEYEYRITVTDAAGKTTTVSRLVRIDTTKPVVAVTAPGASSWTQGPTMTISGTVAEASQIASVEYAVDGGAYALAAGGSNWAATVDLDTDGEGPDTGLAEANHVLHVRATDAAALVSLTVDVAFAVDQNAPTVTVGSPAVNSYVTGANLAVNGTGIDLNGLSTWDHDSNPGTPEVKYIEVFHPGTPGTWEKMQVDDTAIGVTADHVAGIFTSAAPHGLSAGQVVYFGGTTLPGGLDGGTPYYVLYLDPTTFEVSSSSGGAKVDFASDGAGVTASRMSWADSIPTASIGEGMSKKVSIRATDIYGRSTSVDVPIKVDTAAPTAAIGSPADGDWKKGAFSISGTASDATSGLSKVQVAVMLSGQPGSGDWKDASGTATWSYTYDSSSFTDDRTIYVRAVDNAGNVTSPLASQAVHLDQVPPTLSDITFQVGTNPANPYTPGVTVYTNTAFTLAGAAADNGSLVNVTVEQSTDNGLTYTNVATITTTPETWSWGRDATWVTAASEGAYLYRAISHDAAGSASVSSIYTLVIDKSLPNTPVITAPVLTDVFSGISLSAAATASDAGPAGLQTVEMKLSTDVGWTASVYNGTAWTATITLGSEGQKTLQCQAKDKAGNISGTASVTFWKDDSPPGGSITAPTANAYRNGAVTVSMTASDTNGVSSIAVSLADAALHASNGVLTRTGGDVYNGTWDDSAAPLSVSGLDDGVCTLTATLTDVAGRTSTATRNISLDRVKPTVSFLTPAASATTNKTISVTGTSSDNVAVQSLTLHIVKDTTVTANNLTDIFTTTAANNLSAGDVVSFTGTTLPTGISAATSYYVISENLDSTHFEVSATPNGARLDFSTDGVDVKAPLVALTLSPTGSYSWNLAALDTTAADVVNASTLVSGTKYGITLRAMATDIAGNKSAYNAQHPEYTDRSFFIDQQSDRPTIKLTNVNPNGTTTLKLTNTVYGTVSDDDGVTKLEIGEAAFDGVTVTPNSGSDVFATGSAHGLVAGTAVYFGGTALPAGISANTRYYVISEGLDATHFEVSQTLDGTKLDYTSDGTDVTISAFQTVTADASWSYDASSGDGTKRLYFRVTDASSTVFTTDLSNEPRIQDAADDTSVTFKVDTKTPEVDPTITIETCLPATANDTSDIITTDSAHGLASGNTVTFSATGLPGGISANTTYFVVAVPTSTQIQVSATSGGPVVDITSAGSGVFVHLAAKSLTTNMPFGGPTGRFNIRYSARDENGVASVVVAIPGIGNVTASVVGSPVAWPGYTPYETGVTNVTALSDGAKDVVATVTDGSGLASTATRTILVDNSAPSLGFLTPVNAAIVNGEVTVKGTASDSGSGLDTVMYRLGKNYTSQSPTAVGGTVYTWEIPFLNPSKIDNYSSMYSGLVDRTTGEEKSFTAAALVSNPNAAVGNTIKINGAYRVIATWTPAAGTVTWTGADVAVGTSQEYEVYTDVSAIHDSYTGVDLFVFPMVLRATDKAGNSTESLPITGAGATRSNPTSLSSAAIQNNTRIAVGQVVFIGNNARLITGWTPASGTVSWSGDVSIGETDFTIYPYSLRIDPNGDKPVASVSYPDANMTLGGSIRIYGSAIDDDGVAEVAMQIDCNNDGQFTAADTAGGTDWYNGGNGHTVIGSNNWYEVINSSQEFDPSGETPNPISFRVRAKDINGTLGPWSQPRTILVDKNVPKIGSTVPLYLEKVGDPTTTVTYTAGMYIKGNWYLKGSIENESALSSVSLSAPISKSIFWNGSVYTGDTGSFTLVTPSVPPYTNGLYKRIDLNVEIDSPGNSVVPLNFTLAAVDVAAQPKSSSLDMRITIDTKPPTAPTGPDFDNLTKFMVQDNGWCKLTGSALDEGSDVDRVEVYFIRRGMGNPANDRMYNPLAGNTKAYLSDFAFSGYEPVRTGTGTRPSQTSLVDASLIAAPAAALINKGQKIAIGGTIRTIDTWTPGSGTITWADGVVDQGLTAYSIDLAISIDHKNITESHDGASVLNDDGDGYVEKLRQTVGDTYDWYVDVNSANIPDGPIEIHYVVYDEAGNAAHYQIATSVQNSGPQLGAMWLGTDLDKNGSIDETPSSTEREKFLFTQGTNPVTYLTSVSTSYKVKAAPMYILYEITGGNGILETQVSAGPNTGSLSAVGTYVVRNGGTGTPITSLLLDATALSAITDGTRTFRSVIWDTTEETTRLTDSQHIQRDIVCKIKVTDSKAPVAYLNNFFWNSASDNSLYLNLKTNGHIELAGIDDSDPDVSGKISIRGTTGDDQGVVYIWMHIDNFTFPHAATIPTTSIGGQTYYRIANYDPLGSPPANWTSMNGFMVPSDTFGTNGWKFTVVSSTFSQAGHSVVWRLDWDSARISHIAVNDQNIRIVAEDKAATRSAVTADNTTLSGTGTRADTTHISDVNLQGRTTLWDNLPITVGSTNTTVADYDSGSGVIELAVPVAVGSTSYSITLPPNKPAYQVDVVPYITSITRQSPYPTNRTKYGKFLVNAGETNLTMTGFNLGDGTDTPTVTINRTPFLVVATNGDNRLNATAHGLANGTIVWITATTLPTGISSNVGYYVVNTAANYFQVSLTSGGPAVDFTSDGADVKVSVQQNTVTVSGSGSPYTSLTFTGTQMVNSGYLKVVVNGQPSINNTDSNSAEYNNEGGSGLWDDDRYMSVFDVGDYFAGSDAPEWPSMSINPTNSHVYGAWSSYNSGASYYSMPNSYGGAATEIWSGVDPAEYTDLFVRNNAGVDVRHSVVLENQNMTGTWQGLNSFIDTGSSRQIEREGNSDPPPANHSDGQDEMLFQFKNPRFTVKVGAAPANDVKYISYYDGWSKCLKYGVVTGGTGTFIGQNHLTDNQVVVDGYDFLAGAAPDYKYASSEDVGLWSDIGIDPDDGVPVIVYYSNTNKTLKIARGWNTQPVGNFNATAPYAPSATHQWEIDLIQPVNSFLGSYVSMVVDSNDAASSTYGDLFIMTFQNADGNLVFIHGHDVDGTGAGVQYTFDAPVTIDSVESVGPWSRISLMYIGTTAIPYVSYENASSVGTLGGLKIAWVKSGTGSSADDWEYGTIPVNDPVRDHRTNIVTSSTLNIGRYVAGVAQSADIAIGYAGSRFNLVYHKKEQ